MWASEHCVLCVFGVLAKCNHTQAKYFGKDSLSLQFIGRYWCRFLFSGSNLTCFCASI